MQNFKQFLKEDTQEDVYPRLEIEQEFLSIEDDLTIEQKKEIKELICKRFPEINKEQFIIKHMFSSQSKSYITLSIPLIGHIEYNTIIHIKKTSDDIVSKYLHIKNFTSDIVGIYIKDIIPETSFINADHLSIVFNNFEKPISLKNVNKHLNCNRIVFNYPKEIIGNVLSLLLIPNLLSLSITISHGLYPIWMKIINKHLTSKDRDILDCQEELINSGFSQYAKL